MRETTIVSIDESNRSIEGSNGSIDLTPREYSLLICLLSNAETPLSRSDLLRDAWHWDYAAELKTKTVDMHVRRLRMKFAQAGIDPNHIATVRGRGYAFMR